MSSLIVIFAFIICVTLLIRILLVNLFSQRFHQRDSSIIFLRSRMPQTTELRNNNNFNNTNIDGPVSNTYEERQLQVVGGKTKKEISSKNKIKSDKAITKSNNSNIIKLADKDIRTKK